MRLSVRWHDLATGVLTALLFLSVAAGCYDVVDPATGSGLDSLTAATYTGWADGATLTAIWAKVKPSLPLTQRVVTMNTTAGTFTLSGKGSVTLTPDSSGRATVYLQAPRDAAVAQVSASADTTVRTPPLTIELTYQRAQAQSIVVIPDSFYVDSGVQHLVTITAHLLRNLGKPSPGLHVNFSASPDSSGGLFTTALPSDSLGLVTVKYACVSSLCRGQLVTIRAQAQYDTTHGECVIKVGP